LVVREDLEKLARQVAERAYAPYSKFRVGAAVLAGGSIYPGCNVENASYGLTICAERNAIFHAVAAGHARIDALAVSCPHPGADKSPESLMPCGACRQVMAEFGSPEMLVSVDQVGTFRLDELLPIPFRLPQR
jgi:cytidine deaminase